MAAVRKASQCVKDSGPDIDQEYCTAASAQMQAILMTLRGAENYVRGRAGLPRWKLCVSSTGNYQGIGAMNPGSVMTEHGDL